MPAHLWAPSCASWPAANIPDDQGRTAVAWAGIEDDVNGIHSLRKTAINDAIRNGATVHEVREFAGHSDIRTTELYFVRKEEDAEAAARRIQIRVAGKKD